MTKSFSALVASIVTALCLPAHADDLDQNLQTVLERYDFGAMIQPFHGGPAPIVPGQIGASDRILILGPNDLLGSLPYPNHHPQTLETAEVPDWVFAQGDRSARDIALMRLSSTRAHTWGLETAPYQLAHPGPGYVGLIPMPVPDGWVVTNRCLAWDDYYANDERPLGDCYIFEMRPMVLGPIAID